MGCLNFCLKFESSRKQNVHDHNSKDDDDGDGDGDGEKKSEVMIEKEGLNLRRFSWEEVENCTQRFSHVIGSGGFSTVYMGRISGGGGGGLAAAFKISTGSERLNLIFKQELQILNRLDHHNIVKLLGYSDHREEGVLVFEHISGGTLQEKLHNPIQGRKKSTLSWKNRVSIAYQLIQAMEYLHETCEPHIVHGDIKSSNILLNNNHSIKLCDFGSAKTGFSSSIAPWPSSLLSPMRQITMLGSPGYTDPHFLRTGLASKKNDIYSYGVVLLELITGKEAFCSESHKQLAAVMGPMLNDGECEGIDVSTMVDSKLNGNFDVEEVRAMCLISAQCLRSLPSLRPSSTHIMKIIKQKICSIW